MLWPVHEVMCARVCEHWKSYSYAPMGVARTPMGAWCDTMSRDDVCIHECVHSQGYSYAPEGVARTTTGAKDIFICVNMSMRERETSLYRFVHVSIQVGFCNHECKNCASAREVSLHVCTPIGTRRILYY